VRARASRVLTKAPEGLSDDWFDDRDRLGDERQSNGCVRRIADHGLGARRLMYGGDGMPNSDGEAEKSLIWGCERLSGRRTSRRQGIRPGWDGGDMGRMEVDVGIRICMI
jgi:hypothetical protein